MLRRDTDLGRKLQLLHGGASHRMESFSRDARCSRNIVNPASSRMFCALGSSVGLRMSMEAVTKPFAARASLILRLERGKPSKTDKPPNTRGSDLICLLRPNSNSQSSGKSTFPVFIGGIAASQPGTTLHLPCVKPPRSCRASACNNYSD